MNLEQFYSDRRVLITGITGFKGAWLAAFLRMLGAQIYGYGLAPLSVPSLYNTSEKINKRNVVIGDIRDYATLRKVLVESAPEIVFHLAAQPLVGQSYTNPRETYETNILGLVNLIEIAKEIDTVRALAVITTDKVYEPNTTNTPFKEGDRLGGIDPYSASKACAELICSSYARSLLSDSQLRILTLRAGNVIGGGDWTAGRLIPDIIGAMTKQAPLKVRNLSGVRPWQHVLESIYAYVTAAKSLYEKKQLNPSYNIAPLEDRISVQDILTCLTKLNLARNLQWEEEKQSHRETEILRLDSAKIREDLTVMPTWNLETTLYKTMSWYEKFIAGEKSDLLCEADISDYLNTVQKNTYEN